jgi:hypothetical protein
MKHMQLIKYIFIILLPALILFNSCKENDGITDVLAPEIAINGVEQGDTAEVKFSVSGSFLEVKLSDAGGLTRSNIQIDSAGIVVYERTKELHLLQQHDTAYLNTLTFDSIYNINVIATDANSNTSEFACFVKVLSPQIYNTINIVGDASESGWNPTTPAPLVQDPVNPFIFTYEGPLTAGEIKFNTYNGDWCDGDWIIAVTADQSISDGRYGIRDGCEGDDLKWRVQPGEEGDYLITIDQESETVTFEKQE